VSAQRGPAAGKSKPRDTDEYFKYPGGKTVLLPELTRAAGRVKGMHVEPFIGGGRLLTHLLSRKVVSEGLIWDAQPLVRLAWEAVRDAPDELSDLLEALRVKYVEAVEAGLGEDLFLSLREQLAALVTDGEKPTEAWDSYTPASGAYLFVAYTRLTWNGVWRVNQKGVPNVGWNGKPDLSIPSRKHLRRLSKSLQGVVIPQANDWKDLVVSAGEGDLVYLDPPYADLPGAPRERGRPRGFVAYTARPWTPEDHADLIVRAAAAAEAGARVVVSSSGSEHTQAAYKAAGFKVRVVNERRSVNSKGTARGGVPCIIAVK
jgi:DNA adenine methylase